MKPPNRLHRRLLAPFTLVLVAFLALVPRSAMAGEVSWSWLAEKVASSLISQAIGQASGYVLPQQGTSLSNASLSDIQTMIDNELASANYTSAETDYNGAIAIWYNYYRGTTLTSLEDNVDTLKTGSAFDTYLQNALSQMQTCGYACAKMYVSLGQIEVTSQLELHSVMEAIDSLAPGTYSQTDLSNQLAKAETEANTVLQQTLVYKGDFEGQFGSATYQCGGWGDVDYFDTSGICQWGGEKADRSCNYCITYTSAADGSTQTLCPQSDLSWSDGHAGPGTVKEYRCGASVHNYSYPTGKDACSTTSGSACVTASSQIGPLFRSQLIEAARDAQLGSMFYESMAALQKIVNKDVADCGDGVCQIGETRYMDGQSTPWCSQDCTSSTYGRLTSLDATRAATNTTLLSSSGYHLNFSQDGNFLIQNSANTTTYWESNTGSSGGSAETVQLGSDGNLCLSDSSNSILWCSKTTTLNRTTDPPTVDTLTLIDDVLYLTDQYGNVWWESDTDFHVHADLESSDTQPRQCWTLGSQQVLESTRWHNLVWETDGNLNIYDIPTGATVWSSKTSGSNPYLLCNQEDGNLAVYNTSGAQIWNSNSGTGTTSCSSTSTTATGCGFGGYGGDLVLDGDQVRLVSAAGDATWASQTCSGTYAWACNEDGEVSTLSVGSTKCWSSAATIVSTNDAELDWTGTQLVLYDKTPELAGSSKVQLWTPTSTAGSYVCAYSTGGIAIANSSGTALWSTSLSTTASMMLDGCDLVFADKTTGYSEFDSNTSCTFGANGSIWGGY